ncbi:hypothetical protein [Rhizobacter sp. Root29]|uniref:hypothetical protein n=1 Tax=Rhizobacter sp. Root29 TaxID=1736511 RepID=UPI00138F02CE|nr:hypothetical protein [Rhizobacter sp. Root29]
MPAAKKLKKMLADSSSHHWAAEAAELIFECVGQLKSSLPEGVDVSPQACFDLFAPAFEDHPERVKDVFFACCRQPVHWPSFENPAWHRMALLSAMLALYPDRPSSEMLTLAHGPTLSLTQCNDLQSALRNTVQTLRLVQARRTGQVAPESVLPPSWAKRPRRNPVQNHADTVEVQRESLVTALANASIHGEMTRDEVRLEMCATVHWEDWRSEQLSGMREAADLHEALVQWCDQTLNSLGLRRR